MIMNIEPLSIDTVIRVSATTTAQDVELKGRYAIIQNQSTDKVVYFKEKNGTAATAANGMAVPANSTFPFQITADTLSVIGSGSADVAILITKV